MSVYETSAREIYEASIKEAEPAEVLEMSREQIASQLMVDGGMDQESAYYAADQILAFAQRLVDRQQPRSNVQR
jgi:hypothetical protein